ncbi:MAG: VCBS repeat-containing protein [Planctomycetes bacterium]|nr:VCBS repeat-containing protein [Planctomycetota bacterium]MBI3845923.1 VCBS repeat-containing protein [Planctomycetota bacterium]
MRLRSTLAVVLSLPAGIAAAQIDFDLARSFSLNALSSGGIVADVDGDRSLDVVAIPQAGDFVSILYGDGTGGFRAPVDVPLGFQAGAAAAGDFNEDGRPDIAVTYTANHRVVVILGDGMGGFVPGSETIVGPAPTLITAVDVNRNGHLDLVVSNAVSEDVSVLLGDGTGTFVESARLAIGDPPGGVAIGDVNRDGRLDLVVGHRTNSFVSVFLGDGHGGFTRGAAVGTTRGPRWTALVDFNRDSKLDLVIGAVDTNGDHSVSVHLGDGTGTFAARTDYSLGSSEAAHGIVVADFNGDTVPDVATCGIQRGAFFFGGINGTLGPRRDFATTAGNSIAAVDVDRDRDLDLVVIGNTRVSVVRGDGAGNFDGRGGLALAAGGSERVARVGDFDEDGHLDAVVLDRSFATVNWLRGDGHGRLVDGGVMPTGPGYAYSFVTGDFDEDGHLDLVVTHAVSGSPSDVTLLRGDGSGQFAPGPAIPLGPHVLGVRTADLDGDGHLDLIVSLYPNLPDGPSDLVTLLGDGAGNFVAGAGVTQAFPGIESFVVGDFVEDGRPDVAGTTSGGVSVRAGDGAGGFGEERFTAHSGSLVRTVGDLDRDGHLDLVMVTPRVGQSTRQLAFLFGDGTGSFPRSRDVAIVPMLSDLVAADFDEDGRLDLCEGGFALLGDGDGGIVSMLRFDLAVAATGGRGDFDEDGHQDLLCLYRERSNLPFVARVVRNITPFGLYAPREGNVDDGAGGTANVLMVNGRRGFGPSRRLEVDRNEPFAMRLLALPGAASETYALYAWKDRPTLETRRTVPGGIGVTSMPTFASDASPSPRPAAIWSTLGDPSRWGAPTFPSPPAPGVIFRRANGLRSRATFFLQGFVTDPRTPSGFAVTNGILVQSI